MSDETATTVAAPARLLTAKEVAAQHFPGFSERWVYRNLMPIAKRFSARKVRWLAEDVEAYKRTAAAAR